MVPASKLVPVIVIRLPPSAGPAFTLKLIIVGTKGVEVAEGTSTGVFVALATITGVFVELNAGLGVLLTVALGNTSVRVVVALGTSTVFVNV